MKKAKRFQQTLDTEPFLGRRTELRWRQYKAGRIISDQSALPIDCLIVDASPSGNRLTVPSSLELPNKFTLLNLSDGVERRCKLVWRDEDAAGVRFL